MKIALIVAMDRDRGIGKNNDLMWHLPDDMNFFKQTTQGQIVLMGRKNFESIPERFRPLPGRENLVLSRNTAYPAPGCRVVSTIDEALNLFGKDEERTFFVIGGGEVYRLALEKGVVKEMYITHVDSSYDADTFFPEIDQQAWNVSELVNHPADERHASGFTIKHYERKDG